MATVFNNIFICERGSTNNEIVNILKSKYNCWFGERKSFEFNHPNDKVLLFFDRNISTRENELLGVDNFIYQDYNIEGCIKLYCDDKQIKIFHIGFNSLDVFDKNCKVFRDYFIETVKNYKRYHNIINIDKLNVIIYWKKKLVNEYIENILKKNKLLSDTKTKSYVFKETDLSSSITVSFAPYNSLEKQLKIKPKICFTDIHTEYKPTKSIICFTDLLY
jgi:hypothetical protein